jgi:hypothetical protein
MTYKKALTATLITLFTATSFAYENEVKIMIKGDQRCIDSNGTPNHAIGQFPTSGNPHQFQSQTIQVCVDATPKKSNKVTRRTKGSGISITGIIFRPGTAEWYDEYSPRMFSKRRSSGWNLEGMGPDNTLGMDHENAHVDNRGMYHYHAVSPSLVARLKNSLIGYGADGFEIHYIGEKAKSSWQLKSGTRPTKPYGTYDGTYNQDYEYIAGLGNLDECNGMIHDGNYTYFATNTYPFLPRCFVGNVSSDFIRRR